MMEQAQLAMVFATMHQTLEAEEVFEGQGISPLWISVPGDLGLGCGMALGVPKDSIALSVLKQETIVPQSVWLVTGTSWHPQSKETR